MIGQVFPLFRSGHILRQEMLEAVSDHSYRFGELLYMDYSDGILSGCRLTTTRDTIILNPGILCFHKKLLYVKEPIAVAYSPTGRLSVLKASYLGESMTESCITYELDFVLSEDGSVREGQIELCRFTLQTGAYLRCEYVDFEDRSTEYDTLNTIYSPWAFLGQSTLSPDITRAFAKEMMDCPLEDPVDINFCLQLLSSPDPISRDAIEAYIKIRRRGRELATGNEALYSGLAEILKEVKRGNHTFKETGKGRRRMILVD